VHLGHFNGKRPLEKTKTFWFFRKNQPKKLIFGSEKRDPFLIKWAIGPVGSFWHLFSTVKNRPNPFRPMKNHEISWFFIKNGVLDCGWDFDKTVQNEFSS
jgi:hypothetical protein